MKAPIRNPRAYSAILALTVFVSWLGGALFHSHAAAPASCKVCQALQANPAGLPSHENAPRPLLTSERIAAQTAPQAVDGLLLVPQARASPLA